MGKEANGNSVDAIREKIESIIDKKRYVDKKVKGIPDELKAPKDILLSQKAVDNLIDSKLVTLVGESPDHDGLQFFFKEYDNMPSLEIRLSVMEDGQFRVEYIKEEASETKPEFVWDRISHGYVNEEDSEI